MAKAAKNTASKAGAKPGTRTGSKNGVTKGSTKKGASTQNRRGNKAATEEDLSDFEEVAMSDSDVDMEDSLVPRKRPAANLDLDDLMGETLEDEEEFITNANIVSAVFWVGICLHCHIAN